jgi:D-arabinose 1-dehydrogenase-like Zn-dependent alcohol dehydrogenase
VSDTAVAATLVTPFDLRIERYPVPKTLEPGVVLLKMQVSGICGTDKHTHRGETARYAGTDHARSTPFPIVQGHENAGVQGPDELPDEMAVLTEVWTRWWMRPVIPTASTRP